MAKQERGVRSQAIRDFLSGNSAATVKEVVEGLKQKGIAVKPGLVNSIKYGKGTKKGKKAAKSGKAVTRSDLIRRFLAEHPDAKPKEVYLGLKKEGVKVKLGLISAVKYGGKKAGKRKRGMRAASVRVAARTTKGGAISIEQLLAVKSFADSLGGADQMRQVLDALEQLR